ncbi:PREDICTED: connectin-like [Papilio polytes]|uniref:connectin-like n=1 Tax=Papilio polytes TaxID=76194 RepID=UPI000675F2CA|nr:PREDICTED: connectin-like [Papilio polytes]
MRDMELVVKYLLLTLALTSFQISYTESRLNEKRRDKTDRKHSVQVKDNLCEIANRESKVHCYCERTEINTATRADCWVFNGGIDESDPIWASFNSQMYLERLTFNVRSDGALTFIPLAVIHRLKRLQKLYIHYATFNKIEKKTFTNLTSIKEITLMNNKITELDFSAFKGLPALVNLTIKENKITEIQRDIFVELPSLNYLDLSFNNINLAHEGCFEHLSALNDLVLEANLITVLTRDTFRGLANLTRLDLRSNKLSMIGDLTFTELWNLNELLLDNNELKYLSERAFDGLALLEKLSMTGNQLQSINEGLLEGVRGLKLLDLRNNELKTFSLDTVKPIFENLKDKSSVLYLSGNNFICDCQLIWLLTLRNETKSEPLKLALNTITCTFDRNEDNLKEKDVKDNIEKVFELGTNGDVFQRADDELYADNPLYKLDTTERNISSEVVLVDVPIEMLPCPGEKLPKGEDSLMLSSKDESYWQSNSSIKLSVTSFPLIILLLASYIYH